MPPAGGPWWLGKALLPGVWLLERPGGGWSCIVRFSMCGEHWRMNLHLRSVKDDAIILTSRGRVDVVASLAILWYNPSPLRVCDTYRCIVVEFQVILLFSYLMWCVLCQSIRKRAVAY